MEVLPCSNLHYVPESDCPQQGSGTTLMYGGKPNHLEHAEQVQSGDVKVDDVLLNTKECQEEEADGRQFSVEGLPTADVIPTKEAYYDFGGDCQILSSDFHDSVDDNVVEHDHVTKSDLVRECLRPVVDTNEIGLPYSNQVVGSSSCESKWLDEDGPLAVWVKWRGLWQAGIRCARADWPLSTLKAKPTHERKKYLVIFFPRTRNYSWADVLLVRPISDFPHPIAYKTHKVGVKTVKDLTLGHRFIMQRLAISILNIIDQLHAEALEETARSVMVWKEFAMEVSRCKGYPDLGRMLLKFNDMILPLYKKSFSMESWIQHCQNADSAESIEMLKEELADSVRWDELNSLPNEGLHLDLNSQWKNCKSEVMKWFSVSHPVSDSGDVEQPNNDSPLKMELQQSRKRPKLEVRRAEAHALPVEFQVSHQAVPVGFDAGGLGGHDISKNVLLESEPTKDDISLGEAPRNGSPGSVADRWGEIIVQADNSDVIQMKDVELTPINGVSSNSFDHGSKNRQCMAFIESKGRQCVRWANDGDVYCCVHLASRFASTSIKVDASPHVDTPMCGGTTVLGTKCKHRALCGSPFCKKHRPRDENGLGSILPESKHKRKHEDNVLGLDTSNCKDIVLAGAFDAPLQVDPISVLRGESCYRNNLLEVPQYLQNRPSGSEMHCIGLWPHGSELCIESPKRHSLYCEKHLPSWLKRARNGKSRIISKEVFIELLKDCQSRDQRLYLHQACELFYRLLKSLLSLRNPVPKEVQFQWVISEPAPSQICQPSPNAQRSVKMYTSKQKIHKDKDAEPSEFEVSVGQALFDLENTNQELKSELKDLYINSAVQIDVSGNRKAVVIHVPYRLRKAFRKVHVRLVRELEKKFSGKDVIFIATRRIVRPPKRGSAAQRPRTRTLTSVHDAMLEDLVVPAEIVGKRTRYRVDGSKIMKVYLDPKERNNTEYKLETFSAVYRKLSGKDVVFEYPITEA